MTKRRWRNVDSSAIRAVSYDYKHRVLHILFQHGGEYSYRDISKYRYLKLVHAVSVGKYYNQKIKPLRDGERTDNGDYKRANEKDHDQIA